MLQEKFGSVVWLLLVLCAVVVVALAPVAVLAEEISLEEAYAVVEQAHARNLATGDAAANVVSAAGYLSGLWTSSAYPGLQARLVDRGGILYGLIKVPNSRTGGDQYHVGGGYVGSTLVLAHFSQTNYKVFTGTLSGSSITGTLTVYAANGTPLNTLSGVTLTKSTATGSALSQSTLKGPWRAEVLSKAIQGKMTMVLCSGLGEQVGHLEGELNVPTSTGTAPYHFFGYYLNNGEVFLVNTSQDGAVFRTLFGAAQNNGRSVVAQLEENTNYFVGSAVSSWKILPNPAVVILLDGE